MKKIDITAALFIFTVLCGFSKNVQHCPVPGYQSITGLWADSNSTAFTNCYAIFSEKDGNVTFAHYLEFNGMSQVEEGKGSVKGNQVQYEVTVTKVIPGWVTSGTHILTLSDDGKTLRGIYRSTAGEGPLVFKRVK
jgi:hypothetical protein